MHVYKLLQNLKTISAKIVSKKYMQILPCTGTICHRFKRNVQESESRQLIDSDSDSSLVATTPGDSDSDSPCIEATYRLPYEALVEAINACLPQNKNKSFLSTRRARTFQWYVFHYMLINEKLTSNKVLYTKGKLFP